MEVRNNRKKSQAPVAEEVYIPPQATEEEYQNFEPEISPEDQKIMDIHKSLEEVYGDAAPILSQLEAWKKRWGNINISKIGADRKEYYIWRTLLRYEYKEMTKGGAHEDPDSFNEMLVEKCSLYPIYDFQFKTKSDAGVITTLGQQIAYKSGFVSPQEALSLIYIA